MTGLYRATAYTAGFLLMLPVLLALGGCSESRSGPEKSIVSGVVTYDGEPIASGEIMFHPVGATKGGVAGAPVVNGNYIVKGKGGIPHGQHWVEIRAVRSDPNGAVGDQFLPARYNENSTLTAEVTPETEKLDFALTSQ